MNCWLSPEIPSSISSRTPQFSGKGTFTWLKHSPIEASFCNAGIPQKSALSSTLFQLHIKGLLIVTGNTIFYFTEITLIESFQIKQSLWVKHSTMKPADTMPESLRYLSCLLHCFDSISMTCWLLTRILPPMVRLDHALIASFQIKQPLWLAHSTMEVDWYSLGREKIDWGYKVIYLQYPIIKT